jgi:hypothetical protein
VTSDDETESNEAECGTCGVEERVTDGLCAWCQADQDGRPNGGCQDCLGAKAKDGTCACRPTAREAREHERAVRLRGRQLVSPESHEALPFCACGRRMSECDGSRRGCMKPNDRRHAAPGRDAYEANGLVGRDQ